LIDAYSFILGFSASAFNCFLMLIVITLSILLQSKSEK